MTAEHTCRTELSKLVPYHVFSNEYFVKQLAIVHKECPADKFGDDSTGPCPGLDWLVRTGSLSLFNFPVKLLINVWAFFRASCHFYILLQHELAVSDIATTTQNQLVGTLSLPTGLSALGQYASR